MGNFLSQRLSIPDVILISVRKFPDARGYFLETFRKSDFADMDIGCDFVQDNTAFSAEPGMMERRFLVTGGAGFIGSAVVRHLIENTAHEVLVVDKLTYAGNLDNLATAASNERYRFARADICNARDMRDIIGSFRPDILMHLAAESHVDRSIDAPGEFVQTNVVGTFTLLQAALSYWRLLKGEERERFRFHHVSTDEVFGSLGADGFFTEETPYSPNSPYSASIASSDYLVR